MPAMKKILVAVLAGILAYWFLPVGDKFDPAFIQGKKVLITGASSGIGEQLAYHYARLGASVVITARREDRLKKVIEQCKSIGSKDAKFSYIAADMAEIADRKKVIEGSVKFLGGMDHLLLNHAILGDVSYWYGSEENFTLFEHRMQVGFHSYVYLTSYALPYLERSDSAAIGIVSSGLGKFPMMFSTVYSSTKFALDGFFGSLRQEFTVAKVNISTTLCVLGAIDTEGAHKTALRLEGLNLQNYANAISRSSASDTAWEILRSTALGEPEMYYPYSSRLLVLLRPFFQNQMEWLVDLVFTAPPR